MKINEILIESQLQEGPLLNKLGSAVGKGVGTVAKGVGAVAGGIAGLGKAFKKGYSAGKGTVSGAGDDSDTDSAPSGGSTVAQAAPGSVTGKTPQPRPTGPVTAPSNTAKAASGSTVAQAAPGSVTGKTPQPRPTGPVTAPSQTPPKNKSQAAAPAADADQNTDLGPIGKVRPGADNVPAANDTQYAQAQKAIAALTQEDQKRILITLRSDPKVKAAMAQPAAKKPAASSGTMKGAPGKPSFTGVPEKPANTMANAPVSATNKAKPAAPQAKATAPEQQPQAAGKKKPIPKKKIAPTQAEIDADRERIMGPTSDSVIRTGSSLIESIDEAGLMAKLGAKVGQAAQAAGNVAGKAVGAVQQVKADPEHARNLVKAFATGSTAKDPNAIVQIQDKSGTVPKPIIDKINQLNLEQRGQLHKLLVQKTV